MSERYEEAKIQQIIQILHKSQRSLGELQLISKFLEKIDIFRELKENASQQALIEICSKLILKYVKKETFVFHYGDRADYFYVIINGKVAILIPQNQEKAYNLANQVRTLKADKKDPLTQNLKLMLHKKIQENSWLFCNDQLPFRNLLNFQQFEDPRDKLSFKQVNVLNSRECLGEYAFLQKSTRNASVYTLSNTYFALISKENYNTILHTYGLQKNKQIHEHLDRLKMFVD